MGSGSEGGGSAAELTVERATVKITSDVGEIFGVDQRAYDLSPDDVVQLPEANAGPLVDRDAAERLD
jgi:DNA replication factor GINS